MMLQYSFKIAFLFGPYFPLSFNHAFPMHVELCSSEVPKGTLNMFTTPSKSIYFTLWTVIFFKKINKQNLLWHLQNIALGPLMWWQMAMAPVLFTPRISLVSLKLIMNWIIDVSHLGLLLSSSYKWKDGLLVRSSSLPRKPLWSLSQGSTAGADLWGSGQPGCSRALSCPRPAPHLPVSSRTVGPRIQWVSVNVIKPVSASCLWYLRMFS